MPDAMQAAGKTHCLNVIAIACSQNVVIILLQGIMYEQFRHSFDFFLNP